jgi:hypothetical protein
MSGKPKRHHTVPKFYLEGFADGKMLHAVNIQDGSEHNTNVVNATAESHFYRVPDHPTDPGAFEAALSEAEGVAAGFCGRLPGAPGLLAPTIVLRSRSS